MSTVGLPAENIYGHTKKLRFTLEQIEAYTIAHGSPVSLLDFGCGNGSAVSQFLIRDGIHYYGVDIHEPSLAYARRHFASPNATFLDHIPDGVLFDVIVYADILEHLDDPVAVLCKHHTLLKDHGIIIGSVPNGYGPFENEKRVENWLRIPGAILLAGKIKRRLLHAQPPSNMSIPYNSDSGHVQFFTRKSLLATLRQAGFQIEAFRHGSFLGAPLGERFLLRGKRVIELNIKVADKLPAWVVSTWYFTAKKIVKD